MTLPHFIIYIYHIVGVLSLLLGASWFSSSLAADCTVQTYAGNHSTGFSGDGGDSFLAAFNAPQQLWFDTGKNLYVGDCKNNRIRVITEQKIITTFAGKFLF